jgi:hypothetical protein
MVMSFLVIVLDSCSLLWHAAAQGKTPLEWQHVVEYREIIIKYQLMQIVYKTQYGRQF